jgi:transcriptional regulator with XRE-family HTH domain
MVHEELVGIRELRRLSGWTQSRVARAAQVNHSRISMAENNEITLTSAEEVRLRRVLLAAIRVRAERIAGVLSSGLQNQPGSGT